MLRPPDVYQYQRWREPVGSLSIGGGVQVRSGWRTPKISLGFAGSRQCFRLPALALVLVRWTSQLHCAAGQLEEGQCGSWQ